MKLEYDFDRHEGRIIFADLNQVQPDGEVVAMFRVLDPDVRIIWIKVGGRGVGSLCSPGICSTGWVAYRGPVPIPRPVRLSISKPKLVEVMQ